MQEKIQQRRPQQSGPGLVPQLIAGFHQTELLVTASNQRQVCACSRGSPMDTLFANKLGKEGMIRIQGENGTTFECTDEESLFFKTNLGERLREVGVKSLITEGGIDDRRRAWEQTFGIRILGNDAGWQDNLENKLFFHELLTEHALPEPRSRVVRSVKNLEPLPFPEAVLQQPTGRGGKGTVLLRAHEDIGKILENHSLSFPLLLREYIGNGMPFGVTALIGNNTAIFSALRVQLNFWDRSGQNYYGGIQWLPASSLDSETLHTLEHSLKTMGRILRESGFRGIANFDLLLREKQFFFLECNPRLSGATPDLCRHPELLHHLDFIDQLENAVAGNPLPEGYDALPRTSYEGALISLDLLSQYLSGQIITPPPQGCLRKENGKYTFVSLDARDMTHPEDIFLCHTIRANRTIEKNEFLGFCFTQKPVSKVGQGHFLPAFSEILSFILGNANPALLKKQNEFFLGISKD